MAKPRIEAAPARSGIAPTVWVKLLGAVTVVAVTMLWPVLTCTVIIGAVITERRLVRQRWWGAGWA